MKSINNKRYLSETHPNLVTEWDYSKNNELIFTIL